MTGWRSDDAAAYQSRTTPVVPPIHQSVTYLLDETAYKDIADGGLRETWYSRFSNPTVEAAAEVVRRLEGARGGCTDQQRHGGHRHHPAHTGAQRRPGGGGAAGVRRHP